MKVIDRFEDCLNYFRQKDYSEKTIREYKRYFYGGISHSSIANKKINKLKLTDIACLIEAGKRHGEFGSQRIVSVFRCYLHFLKDNGVKIPFDYRDLEVPRPPRKVKTILEKTELKRIFRQVPVNTITDLRLRAFLELLFSTAMRLGEARSVNLKDIDFSKKEIKIKSSKGGDERIVYLTNRAIYWLRRYLKRRFDNCPALFTTYLGTGRWEQPGNQIRQFFRSVSDKIITPHTIRRTTATLLLQNGADLKATQIILGHKSERTTLRDYIVCTQKKAKQIHQRIFAKILSTGY